MTEAMPFLQKYDITFLRPPSIAEGILLLLLAFAWGAAGFSLPLFSLNGRGIFGVLLLVLMLAGAAYGLWQYRKE